MSHLIFAINFSGAPCDMDALAGIAAKSGVTLIEDAAHALPASYKGRRVGTLSAATAFSFYAGKNMTTGEGGMVTTDDYRVCGRRPHAPPARNLARRMEAL